ncbi:hypothetical protein Skr01_43080 [Sphaerisporangium krabiense]|uniref:DUF6879 domain-containing protein n=1 Tax=Sphaerisporangium krabiense TaxID=763782 RepID=A0A7W8Z0M8_9ACTN|nr:DUF6879 family protein [Sphaerisporangium krabiense]MBB5625261.1 hypothetical protein [Sphaerisporangium krabiense]GII64223.1 hypothetical protein Skr01_43080 [Sphaerisporangium krabiense]
MIEQLGDIPAQLLALDGDKEDFRLHFWEVDASWKLERQLTFKEPGTPSWLAMAEGDWDKSLRLAGEMRAGRREHQRELDRCGIVQRRIRFVCEPPTPYLQWELHLLMMWAELGEAIRILPVEAAAPRETRAALPEVVVLGHHSASPVMYDIQYTDGVLSGARKFTDGDLIDVCRREIVEYWEMGEDLLQYFPREIVNLPPPTPQGV